MDHNNRYNGYDRAPPRQQNQQGPPQQYGAPPQDNFRRNDYGGNGGGRRGGGGGGAMRDHRGRRGGGHGNNDRFNDNRPYNKRPNRMGGSVNNFKSNKNEYQGDNVSGYNSFEDNQRLPPHIESRVAREKPCRTLFVRNVQYTISESDVKALFEKFGEIKDVFNLIENRGMIFVTFYDVRAAEDAKNSMQSFTLAERKIDVHYSLPKEEEEKAKCDRSKNQGTLLYTLKNVNAELDDYELSQYFSQFGEVKAIRVPNFKKTPSHNPSHTERNQQRLVEFYDSRACVDAYDATYEAEYKGGKWDVAFFWDHPYKDRTNANQRRERNNERLESRRGGSDRADDRRNSYDAPIKHDYDNYSRDNQSTYSHNDRNDYGPSSIASGSSNTTTGHQMDPRLYNNSNLQQPPLSSSNNSSVPETQRLEQAQKAQQILSMLAQQPSSASPYQPNANIMTSPPVTQPQLLQQPFVQPVPPTEDQASQVQQLLGLLSQAAQQQQQQQPVQPPQSVQHLQQPVQHQPTNNGAIPGMDPATALSQLVVLLQQQQQQGQNQN